MALKWCLGLLVVTFTYKVEQVFITYRKTIKFNGVMQRIIYFRDSNSSIRLPFIEIALERRDILSCRRPFYKFVARSHENEFITLRYSDWFLRTNAVFLRTQHNCSTFSSVCLRLRMCVERSGRARGCRSYK